MANSISSGVEFSQYPLAGRGIIKPYNKGIYFVFAP